MNCALTRELLGSLRWEDCKVDQHIMRLLGRWKPAWYKPAKHTKGGSTGH